MFCSGGRWMRDGSGMLSRWARFLHAEYADIPVYVAGEGPGAVLAAYAALLEPEIAGVIAVKPPLSHMDADAPQFLNALRVCDIPEVFGMLAPRPLDHSRTGQGCCDEDRSHLRRGGAPRTNPFGTISRAASSESQARW